MLNLEELFNSRRDTRHFTRDEVPDSVLEKAIAAGHTAPTVGLTDATRYFIIRDRNVKRAVKELFEEYNAKAASLIPGNDRQDLYNSLKLEAIEDAPAGLLVCYDRRVLNEFTIGTVTSNEAIKFSAVCAVQNIWLSLTEQGFSMGWVSILHYYRLKELLGLDVEMEPLGYFCIGKPATDYSGQPMLQQLGWKDKSKQAWVKEITSLSGSAGNEKTKVGMKEKIQSVSNLSGSPTRVTAGDTDKPVSSDLAERLQRQIDTRTKPQGSLGRLEKLALQAGLLFGTVSPELRAPHIIIFAADHGISNHGLSRYPMEVTRQMVSNFMAGGAAINVFCRQHAITLKLVDAGVNYDFSPLDPLIHAKIGKGTASFLHGPAMSTGELTDCLQKGTEVMQSLATTGCNICGFGEMGIGNTSSAAILMSLLCHLPLEDCVGRGTGLNQEQLDLKLTTLKKAVENYRGQYDPLSYMAWFGGYEILQITGAMLEAARMNMLVMVDGFIATAAYLCAWLINPDLTRNAVFCHESGEKGHKLLLEWLNAEPLLQLGMRLGEGTGCAVAYPVIKSALGFLTEMSSFESMGISTSP